MIDTAIGVPRLNKQNLHLCDELKCTENKRAAESHAHQIIHLGIGAFHRAHQAVFTQDANTQNASTQDRWKIIGVSLRSDSVAKQLNPQDGLYTVVEKGDSIQLKLISVIEKVLVAPDSPSEVLAALANPNTHIVGLTITEKGYCHDPASGTLNLEHPDIKHDLANLHTPKTSIAYLVEAMRLRIEKGIAPLSILSCDNLPNNGELLKRMVLTFAAQINEKLASDIAEQYGFISTMVDRIVPATSDEDIQDLSKRTGLLDKGLVSTEPFKQWVIEDKFVGPRPAWETAGALLVKDVHAFETMKLRLLNGSHSSIAYLGYLAGKRYVADVMQDEILASVVTHIMINEILPTVSVPEGIDLNHYCEQLLARFNNVHLKHQTYQIAMDGSQKLPQRLVQVIEWHLRASSSQSSSKFGATSSCRAISLVIAAWCKYVSGCDLNGGTFEVQDPFASALSEVHAKYANDTETLITTLLNFEAIFGTTFSAHTDFVKLVHQHYQSLLTSKSISQTAQKEVLAYV